MLGQGRYQEALDHYEKALGLTESLFPHGIAPIAYAQMDVAMAHHGLGNLDSALKYYSMSETRFEGAIQKAADKTSRKEFEKTLDGIRRLNNLARNNATSAKVQEEIQRQLKQGSY
jgi:tetratricopeptide (TPR) repeat protein